MLHKKPSMGEQTFLNCQGQQNCSLLEHVAGLKGARQRVQSPSDGPQIPGRGQSHVDRQCRSTLTAAHEKSSLNAQINARVPASLRMAQSGGQDSRDDVLTGIGPVLTLALLSVR